MTEAGAIYRSLSGNFPAPTEGLLRVWWIPQVPGRPFHWPVAGLREAGVLLDALAGYDDFQYAEGVKGDYANAGGLEVYHEGEWMEWCDEDGSDLDTWRRTRGEEATIKLEERLASLDPTRDTVAVFQAGERKGVAFYVPDEFMEKARMGDEQLPAYVMAVLVHAHIYAYFDSDPTVMEFVERVKAQVLLDLHTHGNDRPV